MVLKKLSILQCKEHSKFAIVVVTTSYTSLSIISHLNSQHPLNNKITEKIYNLNNTDIVFCGVMSIPDNDCTYVDTTQRLKHQLPKAILIYHKEL